MKKIKVKHRIATLFPYGQVYVAVIEKKNFPQYNPKILPLHNFKIAYEKGIEHGILKEQEEELTFLEDWYGVCQYKSTFKDDVVEHRMRWLKKKLKKVGGK